MTPAHIWQIMVASHCLGNEPQLSSRDPCSPGGLFPHFELLFAWKRDSKLANVEAADFLRPRFKGSDIITCAKFC